MARGVPPVYMLKFPGELGCGMEQLRALDEASLHAQFHIVLDQAFHRFQHQLRTQFHQFVVESARRVRRFYPAFRTEDDSARINLLVNHEGGDAGDILPVDHGPVDGSGAAVLRQQGSVQVEGAALGHAPDHLRKHPETNHHKQVGLPADQVHQELLVLEFFRLQQRQALLHGIPLYGALVHLEAAAGRFVGNSYHTHHLVAVPDEGVQRAHGEFRGAHINDSGFTEHTEEFTLDPAETALEQVHINDAGVLNCLYRKERPDGRQHKGRCKFADKGRCGTVVCQTLAHDIHHPVQDEEQHGNNRRRTQTALFDNGADGRADKEQQQAGQRLGEFLPDFHIGPVDETDVVV